MRRAASILLWSVIAAAFIGPGTVTTCAGAGAAHGHALLWALTFSAFGCFVLQEAAARVTIVSGSDLASAFGRGRMAAAVLVGGAIVAGCAAYEAGNILGAVSGVSLLAGGSAEAWTIAIVGTALVVLWLGNSGGVARAMGLVVAVMGVAFAVAAAGMRPDPSLLLRGATIPSAPPGSGLIVIGLVGTTIVPYNLFLGSGLARGQRLGDVRAGLAVAVGLGGLISMAVVVAGTAVTGEFSLAAVRDVLTERLGAAAGALFAVGLFCAGFSSAVTAPLAAAITARGLASRNADGWAERGVRYRAVWLGVLATGLVFGLSDLKPVPVIVLAQALNGLLLPVAAGYLALVVNDRAVMGPRTNGAAANVALAATFLIAVILGVSNVLRAAARAIGAHAPHGGLLLLVAALVALCVGAPLLLGILRRRSPTRS